MVVETITDKELKLKINTDDQNTFTTHIEGVLDCIIIDTMTKIELVIESELGYLILLRPELNGINYLVPRVRTTTPIEDLRDFPNFEPFRLNEKVIFTIIGQPNTEVNLILRLK